VTTQSYIPEGMDIRNENEYNEQDAKSENRKEKFHYKWKVK
jgi:hypothetical protein